MSTSQQLVWNKSFKVDIKVQSSALHWVHVAKNSPGIGSVRSLGGLIKTLAFCAPAIRDVFVQSWPAKISPIDPKFARLTQVCPGLHWSLREAFPLYVHTIFTTSYWTSPPPPVPANTLTCVSDMICSVIDAGTMTVRLQARAFVCFRSIYFCVGMNQKCVPLGHWDRLRLNRCKQIADLVVNLSVSWNCQCCLCTYFLL